MSLHQQNTHCHYTNNANVCCHYYSINSKRNPVTTVTMAMYAVTTTALAAKETLSLQQQCNVCCHYYSINSKRNSVTAVTMAMYAVTTTALTAKETLSL